MSSDDEEIVDAPEGEEKKEEEEVTDLSNRYVFPVMRLSLTIGMVVECELGKP
jgi:hypothetical protein